MNPIFVLLHVLQLSLENYTKITIFMPIAPRSVVIRIMFAIAAQFFGNFLVIVKTEKMECLAHFWLLAFP